MTIEYRVQKLISEYYWTEMGGGFYDETSVNSYVHDLHRANPSDKFRVIDSNGNVRMLIG